MNQENHNEKLARSYQEKRSRYLRMKKWFITGFTAGACLYLITLIKFRWIISPYLAIGLMLLCGILGIFAGKLIDKRSIE